MYEAVKAPLKYIHISILISPIPVKTLEIITSIMVIMNFLDLRFPSSDTGVCINPRSKTSCWAEFERIGGIAESISLRFCYNCPTYHATIDTFTVVPWIMYPIFPESK